MKVRMQEGNAEKKADFVDFLANARDPETGEGFSMQDLSSESASLVAGGTLPTDSPPLIPRHTKNPQQAQTQPPQP
jgi:hypothetical protein